VSDVPSEKVQAKAAEYLLSGRVKVRFCEITDDGRGFFDAWLTPPDGGDPYHVKFNANGWKCDCPARVDRCAHILACQTITAIEEAPDLDPPKWGGNPDIDALLGNN
jgi:hypothetical protein